LFLVRQLCKQPVEKKIQANPDAKTQRCGSRYAPNSSKDRSRSSISSRCQWRHLVEPWEHRLGQGRRQRRP
jgi:hypothetical protein